MMPSLRGLQVYLVTVVDVHLRSQGFVTAKRHRHRNSTFHGLLAIPVDGKVEQLSPADHTVAVILSIDLMSCALATQDVYS